MPTDIDPDTPIRLKDIIPIAFPHGGISVSSLRLESRRGRLTIIRLAGKDFTTLAHIEEMKSACVLAAEEPAPKRKAAIAQQAKPDDTLAAVYMLVDRLRNRDKKKP